MKCTVVFLVLAMVVLMAEPGEGVTRMFANAAKVNHDLISRDLKQEQEQQQEQLEQQQLEKRAQFIRLG